MKSNQSVDKFFTLAYTIFMFCWLVMGLCRESVYDQFTAEGGLFENIAALSCFFACYYCVRSFFLYKRLSGNNAWPWLILAGLFFFVAAEEISWGQRLIGFRPVLFAGKANYQREATLHNIPVMDYLIYYSGFLVILFFGAIVPLLSYYKASVKKWCEQWMIPLMPKVICMSIWLGILFLVFIPQVRFYPDRIFCITMEKLYALRELREAYFSFALFCYVFVNYFVLLRDKKVYDFLCVTKKRKKT